MFFTAFPDANFTIDEMIAEGDTVVIRRTVRGTHKGDLMVIPPTGKQITMTEMALLRVANGKFIEGWSNSDDLGLLQQLGIIPRLGKLVSDLISEGEMRHDAVYTHILELL